MQKKTILVTGGMGYIGSHTVVELLSEGFDVLIVDNLSNSHRSVLDNIKRITGLSPIFEEFDVCDKPRLKQCFVDHDIAAVIHFAAFKSVNESVQSPLKYYQNNLVSLFNLLEVMITEKIDNFVFSSSCTVYGEPDKLPVTELAPVQRPLSAYGNTKKVAEETLEELIASESSIKAIALRYFNPIGAHESALIGELPQGIPNNLIPFITQTAAGIREYLSVFGDDYNTADGSCVRDYIHVVDLAKAHVKAVCRLLGGRNKSSYEVFNLGTGVGYSVLEVIKAFEKASGKPLVYKVVARREGDIEQIYADTQYANEELGWAAEMGIDEMLSSSWAWEQRLAGK